jgi:MerR family transcriptional regulator, light-induced transcriptional regulator
MRAPPVSLLSDALLAVDLVAVDAYRSHAALMTAYVDRAMAERADIGDLLGPCPIDVLYANHADHVRFLVAHLELKSAPAMLDALAWVYRTHVQRGIALRTFPTDLACWVAAAERFLDPHSAQQVAGVYRCIIGLHSHLLLLAHVPAADPALVGELEPYFHEYMDALLAPDMRAAIGVAGRYVTDTRRLAVWWEQIIQPAMYEIGHMWARGEITVGQEHLATAITQRVMSVFYPLILELPRERGTVIVTASPGELHEIGPRILADLIELSGWDVCYTGANTPIGSVIDLVKRTAPHCLCISTSLSVSLPSVAKLIASVREEVGAAAPSIMVGGQAYMADADLWRKVGADYVAFSAREGVAVLEAQVRAVGARP